MSSSTRRRRGPFSRIAAKLELKRVRVTSQGHRTTVSIGDLSIGPFTGELRPDGLSRCRLVHVETVVRTRKIAGRSSTTPASALRSASKTSFAWVDTEARSGDRERITRRRRSSPGGPASHSDRRESATGFGGVFPSAPPVFLPARPDRQLRTVWYGRTTAGSRIGSDSASARPRRGGGSFVPWFNAPPGTDQRLGVFYLLSTGKAEDALEEVLRFTHGDRFPRPAGLSHVHQPLAHGDGHGGDLQEKAKGGPRTIARPRRHVQGDGRGGRASGRVPRRRPPADPGPVRLAEMQAMFDECKRLSDDELLFLPGEEANIALGHAPPGKGPGHWLYLFPRPVYWTMKRAAGQPFVETIRRYGPVYHVGNGNDMVKLLARENGLAWTSHARIKGSSWTPDFFRREASIFPTTGWAPRGRRCPPISLMTARPSRRSTCSTTWPTGAR